MVYSVYHLRKGADTELNERNTKVHNKLRGRIVEKYGTISAFAESLPYSRQTISLKLNGKVNLSRKDMELWLKKLEIPEEKVYEYFF